MLQGRLPHENAGALREIWRHLIISRPLLEKGSMLTLVGWIAIYWLQDFSNTAASQVWNWAGCHAFHLECLRSLFNGIDEHSHLFPTCKNDIYTKGPTQLLIIKPIVSLISYLGVHAVPSSLWTRASPYLWSVSSIKPPIGLIVSKCGDREGLSWNMCSSEKSLPAGHLRASNKLRRVVWIHVQQECQTRQVSVR